MIQTILIMLWVVVATFCAGTIVIALSIFSKTGNLPHLVSRLWARSILFVSRIKVTLTGIDHIDPTKAYIYMPNHSSQFDIPVLQTHLPVQFRWLAKAELFKIPLLGLAMKRVGYISIDRSNRKSAFKSLKAAAKTIRSGTSVVIFPEGTRNEYDNIASFKAGGFVLAIDSGIPIIPVIIHGTRRIMPKTRFRITPGDISMEIMAPIETARYNRKSKNHLMDNVHHVISDAFNNKKRTRM